MSKIKLIHPTSPIKSSISPATKRTNNPIIISIIFIMKGGVISGNIQYIIPADSAIMMNTMYFQLFCLKNLAISQLTLQS